MGALRITVHILFYLGVFNFYNIHLNDLQISNPTNTLITYMYIEQVKEWVYCKYKISLSFTRMVKSKHCEKEIVYIISLVLLTSDRPSVLFSTSMTIGQGNPR